MSGSIEIRKRDHYTFTAVPTDTGGVKLAIIPHFGDIERVPGLVPKSVLYCFTADEVEGLIGLLTAFSPEPPF